MSDLVEELRAQCLTALKFPARPEGPTAEELGVLKSDARWRAADEIEKLRCLTMVDWQPMRNAPKDQRVLLYCPGVAGNVADEIVIGMWQFDANRRSFGYWVSDVGTLDTGFAETGPWIEYSELETRALGPVAGLPGEGSVGIFPFCHPERSEVPFLSLKGPSLRSG